MDSSEHYHNAVHKFDDHGIQADVKLDFKKMIQRKTDVVAEICNGVKYLMDKNKIDVYHGHGSFVDKNTISIQQDKKAIKIQSDKTIIATGSKPNYFPGMEPDKKRIITSTEALTMKEVPKHLVVIGGGVIGLELGSVYRRLGSDVTVVEFADRIIGGMDATLSKELTRTLKKEGFKFNLNHAVQKVTAKGKVVEVVAKNKKGEDVVIKGDYCLVSVGRKPYTDNLGLDKVGIELDERGRVKTNGNLQTNVSNIYAIGDVVAGAMLAHKAEEEGVYVAEHMVGQHPHINYNLIPGVVYTWPEVAAVGQTEEPIEGKWC